jgi:hypothetical protein
MRADTYVTIIRRALVQTAERPYTFGNLLEAYDVMTEEFCRNIDPWISRDELLDWLLAIGPQGQEGILLQINGEYPGWPVENRSWFRRYTVSASAR